MEPCKYCGDPRSSGHVCDKMPVALQNGLSAVDRVFGSTETASRTRRECFVASVQTFFRRIFKPYNNIDFVKGFQDWRRGRKHHGRIFW